MPSVCFYFQLHQPRRLRRYSVFDTGADYFDDQTNRQILNRVTHKCYLPATKILLEQIQAYDGAFRVAFSITGSLLEQLRRFQPEVINRFRELAQTGCVEFLAETYDHSLASLYDGQEFLHQLQKHAGMIEELFGQRPRVCRNTELIYNNDFATHVAQTGEFRGILAEGVERMLAGRSPNHVYHPPHEATMGLLLKNYKLSDDIAFRFSNSGWQDYPLTAEKFAQWVAALDDGQAEVCGLFMDFETFGEHQWPETGIMAFLEALPQALFEVGCDFKTPTECLESYASQGVYDCPEITSWADTERDASAWIGNAMQASALKEIYRIGPEILATHDQVLIQDWRDLGTSDHFYYMCTKFFADGQVHQYFNPYESPYDAYINYMNVLDQLKTRLQALQSA